MKNVWYIILVVVVLIATLILEEKTSPLPVYKYTVVEYPDCRVDTICISCYTENFDSVAFPVGKSVYILTEGVNQRGGSRKHKEVVLTAHPKISYGLFIGIEKAKIVGFFENRGSYGDKSKRRFIHR